MVLKSGFLEIMSPWDTLSPRLTESENVELRPECIFPNGPWVTLMQPSPSPSIWKPNFLNYFTCHLLHNPQQWSPPHHFTEMGLANIANELPIAKSMGQSTLHLTFSLCGIILLVSLHFLGIPLRWLLTVFSFGSPPTCPLIAPSWSPNVKPLRFPLDQHWCCRAVWLQ